MRVRVSVRCLLLQQAKGTFPYEISVLEVESELHWNPSVTMLSAWPLSICDDGSLLYFR